MLALNRLGDPSRKGRAVRQGPLSGVMFFEQCLSDQHLPGRVLRTFRPAFQGFRMQGVPGYRPKQWSPD